MSYLGNLNPYMTPATYAEELRKRNQMLKGQQPMPPQGMTPASPGDIVSKPDFGGPRRPFQAADNGGFRRPPEGITPKRFGPQMSPVNPIEQQALGNAPTNPYGLSPEEMAAMSNDTTAEEAKIKNQMDYANSLRGTKSAGPRQLGNVVVNNPWEGLEVGFNRALGGYLSGKADKRLDALDEQNDAKAAALAAVETSKYGAERSDADRTYDQVVRKQDRAEEVEDRPIVGDKMTYEDSEGGRYSGYWRDDPTDGSAQFYSNGVPIDVSGMREYVDPKSNGYNSNTMKGRTVFQNANGDDIQVAWVNGEAVNPITGVRLSDEEQELLTNGTYFEMAPITEAGVATGLRNFNKDNKGLRQVSNSYSNMLQVFADNGIDISTDNPLGWLEKGQGFLPDIVRLASDDKGVVYSAIKAVLNQEVREAAGMSQTVAEIERINDEYGDSVYKNPAVLGEALRRLGLSIEQDIKEAKAGTSPSILTQYGYNLERTGAADWTSWQYLDQVDKAFEATETKEEKGASSFSGENVQNMQRTRQPLSSRQDSQLKRKLDDPLELGKDRSQYTDDELYELLSSLKN